MSVTTSENITIPSKLSDPTAPSLCIPRVFDNITWQRVKEVLEVDYKLGKVERVDMVPMKNDKGDTFKRVFVHFTAWETSEEITTYRMALLDGEMIRVTYDDPWYWNIGMSHAKKPERNGKVVKKKVSRRGDKKMTISTLRRDIANKKRELSTLQSKLAAMVLATTTTNTTLVVARPQSQEVKKGEWGGEGTPPHRRHQAEDIEYTPCVLSAGDTPELMSTTPTTSPPRNLTLGAVVCAPPLPSWSPRVGKAAMVCQTPDSGELSPLPMCCLEGICKEVTDELHEVSDTGERKGTSQGLCGN